jgi:hypothetical protein
MSATLFQLAVLLSRRFLAIGIIVLAHPLPAFLTSMGGLLAELAGHATQHPPLPEREAFIVGGYPSPQSIFTCQRTATKILSHPS